MGPEALGYFVQFGFVGLFVVFVVLLLRHAADRLDKLMANMATFQEARDKLAAATASEMVARFTAQLDRCRETQERQLAITEHHATAMGELAAAFRAFEIEFKDLEKTVRQRRQKG